LELDGVIPSVVRDKSLSEIERLPVVHGNRQEPLAEWFKVAGDPGDQRIELEGDLSRVHAIGAGIDSGEIHAAGSVGRHAGRQARGGRLRIDGDAGDGLGLQMQGGLIHVRGGAGDAVGAAAPGGLRGMTEGTILVEGSVGREAGSAMRRGLIAVGGCGEAAGAGMLAGTLLVFGRCGLHPGANMRRGTIGLFGPAPRLLPTFRYACRYRPGCLDMLLVRLAQLDYPFRHDPARGPVDLFHGDFLVLGRGEILCGAG
jgi:formylmethanofuran dehydrogenase subunit C